VAVAERASLFVARLKAAKNHSEPYTVAEPDFVTGALRLSLESVTDSWLLLLIPIDTFKYGAASPSLLNKVLVVPSALVSTRTQADTVNARLN
jgi:hypothetical protein